MNFIILDLEATCWQGNNMNRRQEIIEIAAYSVNGYREWNDRFQRFIKPVEHPRLSAYCTELTGITQEQINKAKRFESVFNDFQEWMESHDHPQLMCTWGHKDMIIIKEECNAHDIDCNFLPKAINLKLQFATMHRLQKQIGLLKALDFAGIEFEGSPHRAQDDAFNTAKLFLQYLDQWQY
jgi:3'-5' exoribonuclease 1